jgi:hypothetical protein
MEREQEPAVGSAVLSGQLRHLPVEALERQIDADRGGVGKEELPDRLETLAVRLNDL